VKFDVGSKRRLWTQRTKQSQFQPTGQDPRADCAKQTQSAPDGQGRHWGQACKTNPIRLLGAGSRCRGPLYKRTQLPPGEPPRRWHWGAGARGATGDGPAPRLLERSMRNEPSSHLRRGNGGANPTLRVGAIASNKPNSARPTGRPGPWEGKTCETNPIWHSSTLQAAGTAPNKPNLGPPPREGGPLGGEECETNPIRPSRQAAASPEGQNVRNEPNLGQGCRYRRYRTCKTNPIWPRLHPATGAMAPQKANFEQPDRDP
jgi:hypothetical protein